MANDGMVYLKNARADRGLSPDTSPPPSGLPRANSHTWRWGGGVMRPFCPDGYVLAQGAIARAALFWFPEQIAAFETAVSGELASNRPTMPLAR